MKRRGLARVGVPVGMAGVVVGMAGVVAAMAAAFTGAPESWSGQESAEGALRATLSNGLRVVIVRNTLAPVAALEVSYLVGANETPPGFPGMAHAQEHMMYRGSPGLSASQLAQINAALGGHYDAETRQTVTQYTHLVPAEDLGLALRIDAIRMSGVLDEELLWREERGAIDQEVARDLSSPIYLLSMRLREAFFAGTPYAHDALGTRASFARTTGAMLHRFYEQWYAPNNAVLVVVGDVNPPAVLDTIRHLYGDIPPHPLPARPTVKLRPVEPDTLRMAANMAYGLAVLAFRMPGSRDPDYAAARVLADVLDSERGPLYGLVRQGRVLFTGFRLNALPEAGIGYALAAFPAGGDGDSLVAVLRRRLMAQVSQGVPADLVEAAKRDELRNAEAQMDSPSRLASAWSEAVAVQVKESPEQNTAAIQSVTAADVDRVARMHVDTSHMVVAVVTPQPSPTQVVTSGGFGGRERVPPVHRGEGTLPPWAKEALARLRVPRPILHPTVDTLPNGLELIVQPESVSSVVTVVGQVQHDSDLQTPPGKEGVDLVLDQLFDFGTTELDQQAFQMALDDIGASESGGTAFLLEVLKDHFERGVQLLAQNELQPALPPEAFDVVRRRTAQSLAGELKTPDYLFDRALERALLPPHDPALREATPATVFALTLADVRAAYDSIFRPDMTTIVVVGDVDPDSVRDVVARHFGGWRAAGPRPRTALPPVPPNKPATVHVPDPTRLQERVVLSETLGVVRSDSDYYALELGNRVLGGGFYATRFYRDLREERGLVYTVASSFDIGNTRSFYAVEFGSAPANVSEARAIIVRDLRAMQTTPVSPQELQQAKALALREIPLSEASVDSIATGLLGRAQAGLPLDEPTLSAQHYVRLGAPSIQAAYARWIRPDGFVQASLGPPPK